MAHVSSLLRGFRRERQPLATPALGPGGSLALAAWSRSSSTVVAHVHRIIAPAICLTVLWQLRLVFPTRLFTSIAQVLTVVATVRKPDSAAAVAAATLSSSRFRCTSASSPSARRPCPPPSASSAPAPPRTPPIYRDRTVACTIVLRRIQRILGKLLLLLLSWRKRRCLWLLSFGGDVDPPEAVLGCGVQQHPHRPRDLTGPGEWVGRRVHLVRIKQAKSGTWDTDAGST